MLKIICHKCGSELKFCHYYSFNDGNKDRIVKIFACETCKELDAKEKEDAKHNA